MNTIMEKMVSGDFTTCGWVEPHPRTFDSINGSFDDFERARQGKISYTNRKIIILDTYVKQ